ncbi:hypothetical protein LCGC14_2810210, partial [marine sediment metagenome]
RMNWADIGGRTKVQHVVVNWNYGINVSILCKHHIAWRTRVKEGDRQLPHCQQCIDVLKKLIRESTVKYEFKAPKNYVSPLTGKTYSKNETTI